MKHVERAAPVMAAVTSPATIACCLPVGFAAAAVTASLSMAVVRTGVQRQASNENVASAEDIRGAPAEQQESAGRHRVGADDRLQRLGGIAERAPDLGQRDHHDVLIQRDDQHRKRQQREGTGVGSPSAWASIPGGAAIAHEIARRNTRYSSRLFQSFEELRIVSNQPVVVNREVRFEAGGQTKVDVLEEMRAELLVALARR